MLKKIHDAGKGVIGMKIIGQGRYRDDPAKREASIRYVLGLGIGRCNGRRLRTPGRNREREGTDKVGAGSPNVSQQRHKPLCRSRSSVKNKIKDSIAKCP